MALLGEIRNRFGWLMMGLIGVGLVGFLFMDISPGNNAGGPRGVDIGTVNGESIAQQQMQGYIDELSNNQSGMISEEMRQVAWDQLVREALLTQETNKIGLTVTPQEMGELFLGPDNVMSPTVRQQFGGRTGQVDRNQVRAQLKAFNGDYTGLSEEEVDQVKKGTPAWREFEKRVKFSRLSMKYSSMIQKGLYTPSWMAEAEYTRQNTSYGFSYVQIPYTNIPNDKVTVSDEDLKNYIQSMGKEFEVEASSSIEYVSFPVAPTQADLDKYEADMTELANEFRSKTTSEEDSMFIFQNDGFIDEVYYTNAELTDPQEVRDTLFGADKGAVFGPYASDNHYKVIKVLDSHLIPDSVKASHILRRVQTQEQLQKEFAFLDSLKKGIIAGTINFDSTAAVNSMDPTATKGGNMGYVGKGGSLPSLERYMFHVGKKDSLMIIQSQQGLHLIRVNDYQYTTSTKGVKIAYIRTPIIPSEKTTKDIHQSVNEFLTTNRTLDAFRKSAEEKGMSISTASGLAINGFNIVGLGKSSASADIIKWTHNQNTEAGTVSSMPYMYDDEELNYTKQFVVPVLVAKNAKGLASIDDLVVRAKVDRAVRNKKKAELVKTELGQIGALSDAANKYGVVVQTANNVAYGSANIPNVGSEPNVVAVADKLESGKISAPIQGDKGVFVISTTAKNAPPAPADFNAAKQQIAQRAGQVVIGGLFEALKNSATIEDNRSTFY